MLVTQAPSDRTELSRLTLREIAELPLVCWHSPLPIAPALDSFRAAGIEPNIVLRSDYNEVVQGFAAAGFGIALMPRLAVNPCDCRTAIVDLDGLIPPRRLAIAWHRDRATNEALDAFVSHVAEVASEIEVAGEGFARLAPIGTIASS